MIGRSGERGSGISVLAARHDDDDDAFRSTPTSPSSKVHARRPIFVVKLCKFLSKTIFTEGKKKLSSRHYHPK